MFDKNIPTPPMTPTESVTNSPLSSPTTPTSTDSSPFSTTLSTLSSVPAPAPISEQKDPCHTCGAPRQQLEQQQNLTTTTTTTTTTRPRPQPLPTTTAATRQDAMSRHFPKPTREATMDEMLARTPGQWTLGHWIKNGARVRTPVVDKEVRAKKFADAKAELLRAQADMRGLRIGGEAAPKGGR